MKNPQTTLQTVGIIINHGQTRDGINIDFGSFICHYCNACERAFKKIYGNKSSQIRA